MAEYYASTCNVEHPGVIPGPASKLKKAPEIIYFRGFGSFFSAKCPSKPIMFELKIIIVTS